MHRKGIILAAGRGTRLLPMTLGVNKQLLPIYDKPMIYYPLSLFLHAGIRDVLLIVDPLDLQAFKDILGDGSHFGIRLSYETQTIKRGIADALIIAEPFLDGAPSCLILGDNVLHGNNFAELLRKANEETVEGAKIFGYKVPDPERFGVVTFNEEGKAVSLLEKPKNPTSPYAVPGIYFYDHNAPAFAKTISLSERGELEVTDLNKIYLDAGTLMVSKIPEDVKYFDTGTYDSLMEAALYVQKNQKETGLPIANLESIAHSYGYIDDNTLQDSATKLSKTSYGQHLSLIMKKSSEKK
jgi:glucose-1-phosphate thymidylyltransferase